LHAARTKPILSYEAKLFLSLIFGDGCSTRQSAQVAEKNFFAVEIQHIGAFELVEYGGDHLAAGAGEVGNILVGHIVFDQGFKPDAFPLLDAHLVQKFEDTAFGILQYHFFQLGFRVAEAFAEEV
jgi:hypothetical protein